MAFIAVVVVVIDMAVLLFFSRCQVCSRTYSKGNCKAREGKSGTCNDKMCGEYNTALNVGHCEVVAGSEPRAAARVVVGLVVIGGASSTTSWSYRCRVGTRGRGHCCVAAVAVAERYRRRHFFMASNTSSASKSNVCFSSIQ